jgi:hypothetical protein
LAKAGIDFEDQRGCRGDFHSLRDTFGTRLAVAGVQPFVIKELMRHTTVKQTEKYYIDCSLLPTAAAIDALPIFAIQCPPRSEGAVDCCQPLAAHVESTCILRLPDG